MSILGGVLSTLSYLLLSTPATAVAIWLTSGITSMIAMIATMSLAAESSPEGAEGFAFAAMMSIVNLTGPLSDTSGSWLYQHVFQQRLAPLIIVSAAATAVVFFLIPLMVFRQPRDIWANIASIDAGTNRAMRLFSGRRPCAGTPQR